MDIQGERKKCDTKAGWVLAWMFFIVGARFYLNGFGQKEVLHAWFVCEIV